MDRIRNQVTYDLKLIENEYRSVINQSKETSVKIIKGVIKNVAVKPLHVESITIADASLELWIFYNQLLMAKIKDAEKKVFEEIKQFLNKGLYQHCDKLFADLLQHLMDTNMEKYKKEVALTGQLSVNLETAFTSNLLNTNALLAASMCYGCFENFQAMELMQDIFTKQFLNKRNDPKYSKVYLM